jgi:hypothetical protein
MVIPTYTPGYPPDGSSLGQTKSTIRNNLDGTFETLAIDHINNNGQPGSQPAGYHTIIHQVPQSSVSTVTGYNQVFSGVPGTLIVNGVTTPTIPASGDQQLYSLSGAGVLSQLTGLANTQTVTGGIGYAWLCGVLMQWGYTTNSTGNIGVSFPVPFPNNVFNVQATALRATGKFSTDFSVTSVVNSGFTINNANSSTTGLAYYWFAIGN